MEIIVLIPAMVVAGWVVGLIAGRLWPEDRPVGVPGDYLVAIGVSVAVGLLDWYVVPAMGFSDTLRNIAVVIEPPLGALLVLWLIHRARG